jgi:hypothetical protein
MSNDSIIQGVRDDWNPALVAGVVEVELVGFVKVRVGLGVFV